MRESIRQRIIHEAEYIVITGCTIRKCAQMFNVSKSSVHRDCAYILPRINEELYNMVAHIFEYNKLNRSHRGGCAAAKLKHGGNS